MTTRRDFVSWMGGAAAMAALPLRLRRAQEIRFGYASITWGGDDERAIDEIAALGYAGIQLRGAAYAHWKERPEALRDLLAARGLTFVALSSGNVSYDPAREAETIAEHVEHARWLRAAGGLHLQLIDERPRDRAVVPDDYRRLGRVLTAIGQGAAALGVAVGYHHHMGSTGEGPEAIERVLEASDPRYVKLLLDVAHYQQGGGDPAAMIRRHADRLLFLHVKDVRPTKDGTDYEFVELGRGRVDLPAVFAALRDVRYHGWAIVELDRVTEPGRTPREAAAISKAYIEQQLGLRIA